MQNAIIDAAEDHQRRQLGNGSNPLVARPDLPLFLKNGTGGNLVRGRVLEIGTKLVGSPSPDSLFFNGSTPAPDGTKGIAVLKRHVLTNGIVECEVSGKVFCRLNVNHVQQTWADVDSSSTLLQSKWYGRGYIIWKATASTGEQDAVVVLGPMFTGPIPVIITQSGGIAPNSSGTAKVRWAGADASPTSTITVYYDVMEGTENAGQNKDALAWWDASRQKFVIYELQC